MNKEIKEILEDLKDMNNYSNFVDSQYGGSDYYYLLEKKESKQLLDYITNLQQENERLKEANKILEENWEQYMMRCGKAIEYIEHNELFEVIYDDNDEYFNTIDDKATEDLLNILQNGSDDNE